MMAKTREVPQSKKHTTTVASIGKENIRPTTHKTKPKSKSIAGLFAHNATKTENGRVIKSMSTSSKSRHNRKSPLPEHPMLTSFKETTSAYRQATAGSTSTQLDSVQQDLLDLLHAPNPNAKTQATELADLETALALRLSDEPLTLSVARSDGGTETRHSTLGAIMSLFRASVNKRGKLLHKYEQELREVEEAMRDEGLDLVEGVEMGKALEELGTAEGVLKGLLEEEERAFEEEVKEARNEDRERTKERNRRIKEFVNFMS